MQNVQQSRMTYPNRRRIGRNPMAGGAETPHIAAPPAIARQRRAENAGVISRLS